MSSLNIRAYLERIDYRGSLEPNAETLRALQVAHLLSVPFENLSIHAGQPIVLEDEALFTKIVERRRGGFCYEANGLFATLLRALGFEVQMLSAQVANSEGVFGPDFDHMTLLVHLEQRWLVDVGFGDSFREPLRLDDESEQVQDDHCYRVLRDEVYFLMQRKDSGKWKSQYRFTLQPHEYPDYAEMCRYHQTDPGSHFTRNTICSLATADGRITLSGMRFIATAKGEQQMRTLASDEEYADVLRDHFGVVMGQ